MLPASGELGGGSCNEVTTELTAKGVDEDEDEGDDEDTDDVWQGMMMIVWLLLSFDSKYNYLKLENVVYCVTRAPLFTL